MAHASTQGSVVQLCLALVLSGSLTGCNNPEPGLNPPSDAVPGGTDPRGVRIFETGYENPLVTGATPISLGEFSIVRVPTPSPLYGDVVSYRSPTMVRVRVADVLEPAFLDLPNRSSDIDWNFGFLGPRISLVPEADPLLVRVETLTHGSPPLYEFVSRVDQVKYRLRPAVLVLPVRALVFARADGTLPYLGNDPETASGWVQQIFDAAAARGGTALSSGTEYSVSAREYEQFPAASPDMLWHQCGIQFHLESVEIMPQTNGFETRFVSSTDPCNGAFQVGPLSTHYHHLRDGHSIPLFVGGTISHDLLAEDLGITCFSGSSNAFVAIVGSSFTSAGIVAHELGHVLSDQHHTSDPANLMTPPNPRTRSILGTELTADQCALARCKAVRLLNAFDRPIPVAAANACVPFDPVCGNGIRETTEQCDDGNTASGDGCRSNCTAERCGDAIVDLPHEQCDYGDPAQRENCNAKCQSCDACNVCGDGVVGPGEECDDGNSNPTDKCDNQCRFTFG